MFDVMFKFVGGFLIFIVLAIASQYVGGLVFAHLQLVPVESVTPATLWKYWHSYSYLHEVKLALIAGLSMSVFFLIIPMGLCLFVLLPKPSRTLHGSARFASNAEIRRAGLMHAKESKWPGVVVAKKSGQFLTFTGQQFISLAAPTRSGKGVAIVITNLLSYLHSIVVLDIKLENWLLTSGFRSQHGQECFLFCPGHPEKKSHRWNALTYIRREYAFRVGDTQNIANMLYPSGGEDGFWNDNAQVLFLGLVLYMLDTPGEPVTLPNLVKLTSPANGEHLARWIESTITMRSHSDSQLPILSSECIQALRSYSTNTDKVRSNIMSTLLAPLKIFINPLVAAATSGDDFDLRDVRKKKMTIYIGLSPDDLVNFSLLINLLFSQLINENCRVLPENDPTLKYQCLLLMDEFTSLGKIQIIQKAVAYMAGYNMRLLLIFQNKGQLAGNNGYGPEGASTLLTNCAMKIMFAPKENEDAKEYSEILGYQTVKSRSRSRQLSGKSANSISESDQQRALMLPQEIKEIGFEKLIISMENCRPIFADKIIYWKDPAFKGRFGLPPPDVPPLRIDSANNKVRERPKVEVGEAEILKIINDALF